MRNRRHTPKGKGRPKKSTLYPVTLPIHNGSVQSSALTGFLDSVKKLVSSLPSDRRPLLVAPRIKPQVVVVEQPTTNTLHIEQDRNPLHDFSEWVLTGNVFCPTGEGGGIDPTCSPHAQSYASKVDLNGISDSDVKSRVESTLSSLVSEYGLKLDGVKTTNIPKNEFDEASGAIMLTIQTSQGGFRDKKNIKTSNYLDLDIEVWSSKESLKSYFAKSPDGYLADKSAAGMIRHEYAHALEKMHPEDQGVIKEVYQSYKKQGATVSEYSMYNHREMVAEAFSHYHRQGSLEGTGLEQLQPVFESWKVSSKNSQSSKLNTNLSNDSVTKSNSYGFSSSEQEGNSPPFMTHGQCGRSSRDSLISAECTELNSQGGITSNTPPSQKALATIVYDLIDDVTKAQATAIARAVMQGYNNDKSINQIAKEIQRRLDMEPERALVIAQTEYVRVQAADALTEAEKQGRKKVKFQASSTACEECIRKNGRLYSIKDAQNVIPVHPSCNCVWADPITNNVFCPTGKGGGRDPTCSPSGRATSRTSVRTQHRLNQLKDTIDARNKQRESNRGTGSRRVPKPITNPSRRVGGEAKRSGDTTSIGTGVDRSEPAHPNPTRIASTAERVNAKIDRMAGFFRGKGQHEVAGWMDKLKEHVNKVGVPAALQQLGGTGKKRTDKVQYEGGWDKDAFEHDDPQRHIAAFCESYLNRHGITMTHQVGDVPENSKSLVSSLTPSQGGTVKDHPAKSDFLPRDPKLFTDKLVESKALPGLEKSEDVSKLVGKQVTHLTKEVHDRLDAVYGKDKWIVKAYGDEAAAGYGIYFPQRSRQIAEDARNTIWASGGELAKYGFSHYRDARGIIQGIRHTDGKKYEFGSKEYDRTIDGDVRHWGDQVAKAAPNEQAASLPKGGKEFMVQPAFNVVGISEADRAAGVTIKYGQEGRTHVITRNGEVQVIPHSTWLKGENLPVVFETEDTRAMAKAAKEAIAKFPKSERDGQIYAPDLVKTVDGYKMVEANPANHTGSSGYLGNNPMIIDSYVSHISGKEPQHVRFIRSLLSEKNKQR